MGTDQPHHQSLNRRSFLHTSGAFALVLSLGGRSSLSDLLTGSSTRQRSLADLHLSDFEALVGHTFHVYAAAALPLSVQLAAVKWRASAAARHTGPRHEWFSLAFSGPRGQSFLQGTYTFAHPKLGHFDLFVVPTMTVAHEERHIAIINRI